MIPTYIVDDVESDRYIARRRLAKAGYFQTVDEADDGSQFLRRYFAEDRHQTASDMPDLILLDINMPELNGFETIEELRRRHNDAGAAGWIVALFSSSDNERDVERSRGSGLVEHFFTKPINDTAIAEILETYRTRGFLQS